ncbi:O-antigen ligase family protein [Agromyces sp. ISL-38]|uniref:O-antigen ligase family protein n=1 Tax=Agromyces sp. ISL-38 TaxID=2819107 RepID=UPI001BEBD63A|nr:O-antigen ligase family protein [Agromyces sp. ISL-38]MBT2498986.1 O-antigen ligase family protein [Agromyces sp. ISL-38]
MESIALIVIGLIAVITLIAMKLAAQVGTHALVLMCFAAGFLKAALPIRFFILVVICLIVMQLLWQTRPSEVGVARNRAFAVAGILFVLLVLVFFLGTDVLSPEFADPIFRYFILFPCAFLLGVTVSRNEGHVRFFARTYVGWATVFAALAFVESLSGGLLFGRSDLTRELIRFDRQRAILLSEHPLVLSVLFLVAIPLAWRYVGPLGARLVILAVVVAGIIGTGSRGALALVVVWAAIALLMRSTRRSRLPQVVAVSVLVGGLAYLAYATPSSASLDSTESDAASVEYRFQLYNVLVDSLAQAPFGWGITGLPDGVYLVASAFGIKDLALTVDSEIAMAVFDFGLLGLLIFVSMLFYVVRPTVLTLPEGQAAILVLLSGLYLALHAWTGLPVILMVLLGLCTRANQLRRTALQLDDAFLSARVPGGSPHANR